jgi:small membrane protein
MAFPISVVQVVAVIFALFAVSRVILRLKDGNLTRREFFFWLAVWVILGVLVFVPDVTTTIANKLGIQQGVSLIMAIGLITLFYLMFRLYIKVETCEQNISKLVRQLAIEKGKKKK